MRIIPAIDIIDGKCVRLTKGDYASKKIYNENPLDMALQLEANGMRYLHLVDLDGARSKHIVNYRVLETIARNTSLRIDFGGGIKSNEDVKIAFESGAFQVTGGSIAVQQPQLFKDWLDKYGSERIILGADALNRKILAQGWQENTGTDVIAFIREYLSKGITTVVCTDVSKDGMLQGPAEELYREIVQEAPVKLIASGGISSVLDLLKLKGIGCEGAIIGKAIYEQKITLQELQKLC